MTSTLKLRDDLITASSEYNVYHAANRVRIHSLSECDGPSWCAAIDDPEPWVQFDFEQDVTVWGILVKTPCDGRNVDHQVGVLRATKSDDGVEWCNASKWLFVQYGPVDGNSNIGRCTFSETFNTARFWRIYVEISDNIPSMKVELIGTVA